MDSGKPGRVNAHGWDLDLCHLVPTRYLCVYWAAGAKFSERHAFQRMVEHIQEARDWRLLHRNTRRKNPFFEWVLKHGFHGIQLSLLALIPHGKADLREVWWMHRFARALLLNKYIPDLRVPKWAWLLKVNTFKNHHEKREKISAKAETLHRATNFLQPLRTTLSLAEQLRLVVDSRELCSASVATQVFTRAQRNIHRETGTKLPRKFVLGIPLLDPLGKRALLQAVVSTFQTSTQVPALYREFLCKSVVCVRKSTPSVMSVCQSYKPELTTDAFERKLRDN